VVSAHDRALRGPPKKPLLNERIEHEPAIVGTDVPEANRLRERQFQARHVGEVAPHAFDDGRKMHLQQSSGCADGATGTPQLTPVRIRGFTA
jgi:hypothetical protein